MRHVLSSTYAVVRYVLASYLACVVTGDLASAQAFLAVRS